MREVISSTSGNRIREVTELKKKRSARLEKNAFVIEGIRIVREALSQSSGERVRDIFMTEAFYDDVDGNDRLLIDRAECGKHFVTEEVMKRISDTVTPQGVVAVADMGQRKGPEDLIVTAGTAAPLIVMLENLQDPGNLGTIIRTGEGAGVTGVVLASGTVDPYNPKVVRGTMGSIFRMPLAFSGKAADAALELKKRGVRILACDPRGSGDYCACDMTGPVALLVGNEGAGLSGEALETADTRIAVPMMGALESLNAAVCTAVVVFEAARQRRAALQR